MNQLRVCIAGKFCKAVILVCTLLPCLAQSGFSADFNRQPDVLINTAKLSELPKDVISIPLLKDLLTEDFVFYYKDSGANWMSFKGALARMAFEHDLDWPTRLLSWMMRGPAEIALWKGDDGKLSNFMLVIDQTGVKELAALVAQTAAKDAQLKTEKGTGRNFQALTLSTGKAVYLASEESRLFLFSDPEMKLPVQSAARGFMDRAKAFFGGNTDVSIFGPKLEGLKHRITLSAEYLSFGYKAFFDGIKAVRFDFQPQGMWSTGIFTNSSQLSGDAKSWSLVPKGAAFCVNAPIEKKAVSAVVHAEEWLSKATSNAIACWYPESKLYTPMIALGGDFKDLLAKPENLKKLFSSTVGVRGAVWKNDPNAKSSLVYLPMLPVLTVKTEQGHVGFTREIGGRYGLYPARQSKTPAKLGSSHFFRVKVVATPDAIVFSPDDRLVDKAVSTLDGKFPSMSPSLPPSAKSPLLIFAPDALSKLARDSILESLPESQESIFRTAISRQLFPNLERFAKRPLHAASVSGSGEWKSVDWTTNASH